MNLFRAEWNRLALAGGGLALAHLGSLLFLSRMMDLAQQNLPVYWSFAALYALVGTLLGYAQFQAYARPNQWLSLLHRPQAPLAIARSLLGAGLLLLLLIIALPIVLTACWQEAMTARVVDLRHYGLAASGWQIAACAYLCGVYAALARRWCAPAGLTLLYWLISAEASGPGALLVQGLALLWSAWMVAAVFRADRGALPRLREQPAVALPLALAMHAAALLIFATVELGWIAWGTHPNNGVPPAGGHNEMEKGGAQARMLAALAASTHPDAPLLAEQVRLSEPQALNARLTRLPQRHELSNVTAMEFDDDARGTRFVYSHDDGRFHGYRIPDGVADLPLDTVFANPPLPFGRMPGMHDGDAVLVAGGRVYHYESETRGLSLRLELPTGEVLTSLKPIGESLAVLSDAAVYVYDVRPFLTGLDVVSPRARLPLQGRPGDLSELDLIELLDGHLIVATYGRAAHQAHGTPPFQSAEILRSDGQVVAIARRELSRDFGWLYRYQSVWLSPVLYTLRNAAQQLAAAPDPLSLTQPEPWPLAVWVSALSLQLTALLLGLWRWRRGTRAQRWLWPLASGILGLPMWMALRLIEGPQDGAR